LAVLPIVKYGNDVLRRRTEPVTLFDEALQKFINDMVDTMYAAPGIGLAANQVGDSRRVAVIDLSVGKRPGELRVFVNPEIAESIGQISEDEGCLSIPDLTLMARAMSHEIDHLEGKLFVDRLRGFKRDRIIKKIQKLAKAGMW